MIEETCTNCGTAIIVVDEPNVCMLCGRPLCSQCYDESPYCADCERPEQGEATC
jgi:hypothetical protein